MLKLLSAFFLSLCAYHASAQIAGSKYTLNGEIKDSLSHTPIKYATIVSVEETSTKFHAVTDDQGKFSLSVPKAITYNVTISCIGYITKHLVLSPGNAATSISRIWLQPLNLNLREVNVQSNKPIITRTIDRIAYHVQNDPESVYQSLYDVFRKVPLLSVYGNTIQLQGQTNFRVLVNERTTISGNNLSDVLKSMPAFSIERIEVITIPPAKYDGEGFGGIINIVTKRPSNNSYNARIGLKEVSPSGPAANGSFNYRKDKLTVSAIAAFTSLNTPQTRSTLSRIAFPDRAFLMDSSLNVSRGHFLRSQLDLSYEIDSLRLLTLTSTIQQNGGNNKFGRQATLENIAQDRQVYQSDGSTNYRNQNIDMGLNYEIGFRRHKGRRLTFLYSFSRSHENIDNVYGIIGLLNYPSSSTSQDNTSGRTEHTLQADFNSLLSYGRLETGLKAILRNNFSNFYYNNALIPNSINQQLNDFSYHQNVYSSYVSYTFSFKKWQFKPGLRMEITKISSPIVNKITAFQKDYTNALPSMSAQRLLSAGNSFSIGYSRRIERPGIWQLNPFQNSANPRTGNTGNPDLKVATSDNFESYFSHSGRISVDVGPSYSVSKNNIQIVAVYVPEQNFYLSTYQNALSNKRLGANISLSFPLNKNEAVNINSNLSKVWLDGTINGQVYTASRVRVNASASITHKFSSTMNAAVNGAYNNGLLFLQGRTNGMAFYSASLSKRLADKFTLSVQADNLFNKYRTMIRTLNTLEANQVNNSQVYNRQLTVNLSYRFGKSTIATKQTHVGINNNDVKTGN